LGLAAKPIHGVVIISDPHSAQAALTFAQQLQWPVFAEPGSMARTASVGIQHYAEILKDQEFVESHQPDVVITAGRFGLSRSVAAFVKTSVRHIAVGRFPLDADPWRTAVHHLPDFPTATGTAPADGDWLRAWQQKDGQLVSADLEWNSRGVINQYIARLTHHDLVWVSASMPIRIVDDVARLSDSPMMLMNRGANGIDGVIASASGAALVHGAKAHVIIGDVAFIHDASSLFIPSTERHPDLRILVVDNNRGAIFETLEQGASEFSNVFSRIYGTPHASNLAEVAAAAGWASQRVSTFEELESAVEADIQVIVARVPN
jgi:2-succinyl-5-enolpyruvyl-6-hydroxy-3-cyclohexene-1-carboxylate synthase